MMAISSIFISPLILCVEMVMYWTNAALTKDAITNSSNSTLPPLRCLHCHSESFPDCYDPVALRVPVTVCESFNACYTRFGVHDEVERGCFDMQALHVMSSCATPLCNDFAGTHLPVYHSDQISWRTYLRSMNEFVRYNNKPLTCISCATRGADYLQSSRRQRRDVNSTVRITDDCFNPIGRKNKRYTEKLLTTCQRDEVCLTELQPGNRVFRGCSRKPMDSQVVTCSSHECNNHVDLATEIKMRQALERAERHRNAGQNRRTNAMCRFGFVIIFLLMG